MNTVVGFILGLVAMVFFGFYGITRKYVQTVFLEFLLDMGIGALFTSSIISYFFMEDFRFSVANTLVYFLSGLLWYTGTLCWTKSIDYIGFSSSVSIKNINGLISTLYGIILFNEYSWEKPRSLFLVLIGGVLVVGSVIILGRLTSDAEGELVSTENLKKGVFLALGAAVGHASYTLPGRIILGQANWGMDFFAFTSLGIFLASLIGYLGISPCVRIQQFLKTSIKEHLLGMLSGILYALAFFSLISSMNLVGMSIGMLLANMNIVVALPFSIILLKEISFHRHKKQILVGLLTALVGTICLALSKM